MRSFVAARRWLYKCCLQLVYYFCFRQFSLAYAALALPTPLHRPTTVAEYVSMSFSLHSIAPHRSLELCKIGSLLPWKQNTASIYEQLLHASMYGLADSSSKDLRGSCLYSGKNSELSELRKFTAARWDISSIHRKYIYLLCSISSVAECESWESNTFNLFDSRL